MSRCNKIVCDLCGEHMDYVKGNTVKIKIKKILRALGRLWLGEKESSHMS